MASGIVVGECTKGREEGLWVRGARGGTAAEDVRCGAVAVIDEMVCGGVVD